MKSIYLEKVSLLLFLYGNRNESVAGATLRVRSRVEEFL